MKPLQTIYLLRLALGIVAALICIGYGLATDTIPRNLIVNPSAEAGETGTAIPPYWFSSGIGAEWSMTDARIGSRSIRIDVVNASAEWKSGVAAVHEGVTYQIGGCFKGEVVTDQFFLTIRWFSDSGGANLIAENDVPLPVRNYPYWSPVGNAFAAPLGTRSCQAVFRAVNGSGDLYGDDFEVRQAESLMKPVNGLLLAAITYMISYYIIKPKFLLKVEKPQKIFTAGIGIYFLTWLVFWILMYSIIAAA